MLKNALAIAYKDFQIEYYRKAQLISLLLISFIITFLSSFVVFYNPKVKPEISALVIWLLLISIAFQTLNKSLASEEDAKCWDALCLCPISMRTIFLGKFIYNSFLMIVVQILVFPFYLILFDLEIYSVVMLLPICLSTFAFIGIGLLIALFALKQQGHEMLINAMSLPFVLPVLFIGLRATLDLSTGVPLHNIAHLIYYLLLFDATFITICFFAFNSDLVE